MTSPAQQGPRARRLVLAAIVSVVVATAAGLATAQDSFRLTHSVDRSNPSRTRVTGHVTNEGRIDVLDVYVTAEALDASGKVVARGIAFVAGSIPQQGRAPFSITVPAPPNTANFRVQVSSFRQGLAPLQGP